MTRKARAYGRDLDGAPREEIPVIAERGEERDASPAVRHRIQQAVRCGHRARTKSTARAIPSFQLPTPTELAFRSRVQPNDNGEERMNA
mgnify:CR=1 FL=1